MTLLLHIRNLWSRCFALWMCCILCLLPAASATAQDTPAGGQPDPQIAAALKQISAEHIQSNIEKLVSFGTRLTLSAQDPASIAAGRGIGAAREWIKSEFERYSRDCGGCLDVKTDSFTEPAADRIPKPTVITNVYAVLKGTDPEGAKRMVQLVLAMPPVTVSLKVIVITVPL